MHVGFWGFGDIALEDLNFARAGRAALDDEFGTNREPARQSLRFSHRCTPHGTTLRGETSPWQPNVKVQWYVAAPRHLSTISPGTSLNATRGPLLRAYLAAGTPVW